jgi:hypothetical protein
MIPTLSNSISPVTALSSPPIARTVGFCSVLSRFSPRATASGAGKQRIREQGR